MEVTRSTRENHYPGCKCVEGQENCTDFAAFVAWIRRANEIRREQDPDDKPAMITEVLIDRLEKYAMEIKRLHKALKYAKKKVRKR